MANKKINDLDIAGAVVNTMQYETDIGGSIANRVTSIQIGDYVNTVKTYSELNTTNKVITNAINETNNKFLHMGEPNGIIDKSLSTISFVNGTRTFSINPTGSDFDYYQAAVKYTTAGNNKIIDDTEGLHILYYDGVTLSAIVNPSDTQISDITLNKVLVAYVYWDKTNQKGKLLEERHGITMDGASHLHMHFSFGTQYQDGLALGNFLVDQNGSLDSHAQFSTASGTISDEDLQLAINAVISTTGLEIWYLDGSDWRWTTNTGFSVRTTGTGRLAFNDSGAQTEVTNNDFVLCHVFGWNATDQKPIVIQGQNEYSSITAARQGAQTEIANLITTGLPSPEMKAIGTAICQTSNTYTNAVKGRVRTTDTGEDYVDFRKNPLNSTVTASDHGQLAGLTDDDHLLYVNKNGRAGGQTIYGGIAASENLILGSTSHATKGVVRSMDDFSIDTGKAYQFNKVDFMTAPETNNVCIGFGTNGAITTAQDNVFIGTEAGDLTTSGSYNAYIGYQAGKAATTAQYNAVMGYQAGLSLTTASNNVLIGTSAGATLSSESYNVFIGAAAGIQSTSAQFCVGVGYQAGRYTTAGKQVFIGYEAGEEITSGGDNVFIGNQVGNVATTTANSVLIGSGSARTLTTGGNHVLIGKDAGASLTTHTGNVLIGYQAGQNLTASNKLYIDNSNTTTPLVEGDFSTKDIIINGTFGIQQIGSAGSATNFVKILNKVAAISGTETVIDYQQYASNMAAYPLAQIKFGTGTTAWTSTTSTRDSTLDLQLVINGVLERCLYINADTSGTGNKSVAVGPLAGKNLGTTAFFNTLFGYGAGRDMTTGSFNTAIGNAAGENLTIGSSNTLVGVAAGEALTTQDGNVFIGTSVGQSATVSNQLYIDNSNTATPLIWGDFSTNALKVNGTLEVTGKLTVVGVIDPTGLILDPQGSPPSSVDGTIYYDSGTTDFQFRENGAWITLSAGGSTTYAALTDVIGAYTTGTAIWRTNSGTTGMEETTTKLGEPLANQFTFTRGTTTISCVATCNLNQNLSTAANVIHATQTLSGNTYPLLVVKGPNTLGSHAIRLDTVDNNDQTIVEFFKGGTKKWQLVGRNEYDTPNDRLALFNDVSTEIMTWKQNGRVGIGVTDSNSMLEILGNTTPLLDVKGVTGLGGSTAMIRIDTTDVNDQSMLQFNKAGSMNWQLTSRNEIGPGTSDRLAIYDASGNDVMVFFRQGTDDFPQIGINTGGVQAGLTGLLSIYQGVTDAAAPTMSLVQMDGSEGYINFVGSFPGSIATSTTNSENSIRVEINGTVKRIPYFADA